MLPDNFLERPSSPFTSTWQQREVTLWCRMVNKAIVRALLVSCSIRLSVHLYCDTQPKSLALISVSIVSFLFSLYMTLSGDQSARFQQAKTVVLLQLTQVYLVVIALFVYPEIKECWAIASSMLFTMFELPSFRRVGIVVALVIRQFVVWFWVNNFQRNERTWSEFPVLVVLLTIMCVLYFSLDSQSRAKMNFRYMCSIEEQDQHMKDILQAIPEGLAVVTEDKEVLCSNARLQTILKSATLERDLVGILRDIHCYRNVDKEKCEKEGILGQIETFLRYSGEDSITFGVTRDAEKYYEWKGTKCVWGKTEACIVTAADITPWAVARRKLMEENEAKTALLRFVSHELRTPTNAILNLSTNVMSGGNLQPEQKLELSIVVTSTYFLLSVVNDLLDFTRIVANKFALVKQPFAVRKEIRETVGLVELQCAHKGIYLKVKIDELIPETIYSDPNRLKQVLLNLLGNAVKFTFKGGIRVICMLTDRNMLRITVKDTGIGIPKEKIAGLCQAFGTVEGTQRINPQGCGLGLYISNLLALSLGSKPIDIQSIIKIGSEFSFQVQIYQTSLCQDFSGVMDTTTDVNDERDYEESVDHPGFSELSGRYHHSHPNILVVDDSDFNRVVLVKMLEAMNVRADETSSGLRALSLIQSHMQWGHCYRLILMDMEMPEMDGVTATQEIRAMELAGELTQRPRIVGCSAHRGREDIEKCLIAGMDDYIEKPISRSRLFALLTDLGVI